MKNLFLEGVAAATLALAAALLAMLCLSSPAHALDVHPWRGVVRICAFQPGNEAACSTFQTPEVYETEGECIVETRRRAALVGRALHAAMPGYVLRSQQTCVPERSQFNV